MNAIGFINTLKPLLADYDRAMTRKEKAEADMAAARKLVSFMFKELPEDQQAAIWRRPFFVLLPEGGALQVTWGGNPDEQAATLNRVNTFAELLPQEGGADAV